MLKPINNIVRCGNVNCDIRDKCLHAKEHKRDSVCNEKCVRNNGSHKCYNIIEERKIKLTKLQSNV